MKNIMLTLVIMSAASVLTSCGKLDRGIAHITGHSEMCIDGVKYIQFSSGATVKLDRDGKPVPC